MIQLGTAKVAQNVNCAAFGSYLNSTPSLIEESNLFSE